MLQVAARKLPVTSSDPGKTISTVVDQDPASQIGARLLGRCHRSQETAGRHLADHHDAAQYKGTRKFSPIGAKLPWATNICEDYATNGRCLSAPRPARVTDLISTFTTNDGDRP